MLLDIRSIPKPGATQNGRRVFVTSQRDRQKWQYMNVRNSYIFGIMCTIVCETSRTAE